MYTQLEIANFRCFEHLEINDLGRVNLIAGMNNVGKTAVLEAVMLLCGEGDPEAVYQAGTLRALPTRGLWGADDAYERAEEAWLSLFRLRDARHTIAIRGESSAGATQQLVVAKVTSREELQREWGGRAGRAALYKLEYDAGDGVVQVEYEIAAPGPPLGPDVPAARAVPCAAVPTRAPADQRRADAARLSAITHQKRRDDIVRAVRVIEPRLMDIQVLAFGPETALYADLGEDELTPLALSGEGMVRLTSLALAIADTPGGIVLIDEIENGLHHSVLPDVWRVVAEAARQVDCQVFATTHSYECIQAAHEAFQDSGTYDLRLHRLDRIGDTIEAVTYDQETLQTAIELEREVR